MTDRASLLDSISRIDTITSEDHSKVAALVEDFLNSIESEVLSAKSYIEDINSFDTLYNVEHTYDCLKDVAKMLY